jgi:hypothetical protein
MAAEERERRKGASGVHTGKEEKNRGSFSRDAKVADMHIASQTLADAKDHSLGYDKTMQLKINDGDTGKSARGKL